MTICFQRLLAGVVLAAAWLSAWATSAEHEAAALFGLEYDEIPAGSPIRPGKLSCVELETRPLRLAGEMRDDWQAGSAQCSGRRIELLKRRMSALEGGASRWRIEDLLLLPVLGGGAKHYLARDKECKLGDAPDDSFIAVLRRRPGRVPAVEQLWTYDLEKGRLRQQAAARLECNAETAD